MAKIGNWGRHIKFSVNSDKALSFKDFKRTVKGRWAEHPIINEKPRKEFQGPDASGVTMEVIVSAHLGVSPKDTIEKLEKACEKTGTTEWLGTQVPLIWLDETSLVKTVKAPPMAEEIAFRNGRILILTESASNLYLFGKFTGAGTLYSYAE